MSLTDTGPNAPVTEVVTGLDLSPEVLRLAHWRGLPPLPTPAVAPFDLDVCCERLGNVRRVDFSAADWQPARIRWGMSAEEAKFWVAAGGRWCRSHEGIAQFVAAIRKVSPPAVADLGWVRAQLGERQRELPAELAVPLATLLGPAVFLETLLDGLLTTSGGLHISYQQRQELGLYRGFWELVLPYLDRAELATVRDAVRPKLDPELWPKSYYDPVPRAYLVAGILGMAEELEELVRRWPTLGPKDPVPHHITSNQPYLILFGLGSPERIEAVARNLGQQPFALTFQNPFELRGWLSATGTSGLDFAAAKLQHRDDAWHGALSAEFCRVPDPAAAPHVLGLKLDGRHPATARRWLTRNVGSAVAGLLTSAVGRGRTADAAVEYFHDLNKTGYGWVLERELATAAPPDVAARLKRVVLEKAARVSEPLTADTEPVWLTAAFRAATESRSPMPDWLQPATLPPILVDGRRLPDEKVATLIRDFKGVASDATPHLAATLAAGADAGTCDRFAAALFERWVAEKNNDADGWVLTAVGWLGGDATVAAVVPKLKRWPGGAVRQRLRDGLKALRRIGTPYALAQLASLAATSNQRLRYDANLELQATAKERKLSLDQLEDRTVPTLGLDDPTSADVTLDYGPRQFRATVAPDLRLLARDDHGKAFLVLPTPRKSDDMVKVGEARTAWKLAKKQFELVMAGVCKRMEAALTAQRRWSAAEFDEHLVRHPITGAVVRRLLWGRFDPATRRLLEAFRVSAEGEFVDADDRPLPASELPVGLIHPALLLPADRATWDERLADYAVVPPFPQLARPVVTLTEAEREATDFTRWNCKNVSWSTLKDAGPFVRWTREQQSVARTFPAHGLKAVARLQGQNVMELLGVSFRSSVAPARGAPPEPFRPLGTVDPVVLSEALADVRQWPGVVAG